MNTAQAEFEELAHSLIVMKAAFYAATTKHAKIFLAEQILAMDKRADDLMVEICGPEVQ